MSNSVDDDRPGHNFEELILSSANSPRNNEKPMKISWRFSVFSFQLD
jgi:hypothetical protein